MSAFEGLKFNDLAGTQQGRVTQAIASASRRTGVDFNYLMSQARVESAMNPTARAATSSATGLYQFIDQSWLAIINDHGAKHGIGWAADAIQKTSSGNYYVADASLRQQILNLRNHPETASVMAAELASDNREYLESRIGRRAEAVDLYLAHFLGAGGAAKFLTSMASAPGMAAAPLFPAAARANSSIFYDRDGNARSLADIRATFAQKLASGGGASGAPTSGSTWAMPDGTRMVQPADYMRIAQERLAQTGGAGNAQSMDSTDGAYAEGDAVLLADIQALTLGRTPTQAAPNAQAARLAYLTLETLGR